jgi:CxxC motif-containing protein (DUF1111 family)
MRRLVFAAFSVFAAGCLTDDPAAPALSPDEQLPGGTTTNTVLLGTNAFIKPVTNITSEHRGQFFSGNSFFNQAWVQAPASTTARDGLGPLFNARSCSGCHFKDGRGRPPLEPEEPFESMLLRIGLPGQGEHGEPRADPLYGGQLQPFGVAGVPGEGTPRVTYQEVSGTYADGEAYSLLSPSYSIENPALGAPDDELLISARVAPAVVGLGLLQALPLERLEELADPDDLDGDGISGKLNWVWDVTAGTLAAGRFGWKAEQPSVRQQSAGAFLGDLGVTSSLFTEQDCTSAEVECLAAEAGGTPEIDDQLLDRIELYGLLLAVPVRERWKDAELLRGRALFHDAGCSGCHVPNHRTGTLAGFPEVSDQSIWPYTDLLLHDMGPELSDGRPVFAAEAAEWRTPPLWGLRFYRIVNGHDRLLHDGRARGVAEAILWHGGEAEAAREIFRALPAHDRARLIAFVESL